jgi:hypothetical protein
MSVGGLPAFRCRVAMRANGGKLVQIRPKIEEFFRRD